MAKDDGSYCAFCPELDLVTELNSEDAALTNLLEAMKEYAQEFLMVETLYRNSPNRAHHYPYIKAIAACKNDWEIIVQNKYEAIKC